MRLGPQSVAVITGAASGIGRALALEPSRRGTRLALIDIDRAGLDAVAAASSSPGRCSVHVCDLTDPEAVQRVSNAIVADQGAVHLLINNAGISVAGAVEDLTLADFQRAMAVNYFGVVHGCQAFLPHLRAAARRGETAAVCNVSAVLRCSRCPQRRPCPPASTACAATVARQSEDR